MSIDKESGNGRNNKHLKITAAVLLLLTLFVYFANADAPTITEVVLNSTSGATASTNDNLTCYASYSDPDGHNVSFNYKWYINDDLNSTRIPQENNAIIWFPFDNDVYDYILSNNGTIQGEPSLVSGKVFGAYDLDGVNDYISVVDSPSLNLSDNATWSFWVNRKTDIPASSVIDQYSYIGDQRSYAIKLPEDEVVLWNGQTGGSSDVKQTSSTNNCGITANNTWIHLVVTFENGEINYYKNGVLCDTQTSTNTQLFDANVALNFGRHISGPAFFNGTLDEIIIWNRTINAGEVSQLYYSTSYGSPNIYNYGGTEYGDIFTCEATPYDYLEIGDSVNSSSLYILNNSDYLNLADNSNVIFVDKYNLFCNDTYSRSQALSGFTPWCSIANNTNKISDGDKVYLLSGTYNGKMIFDAENLTTNVTFSSYPYNEVNLTDIRKEYLSTPNSLWTDVGNATHNIYLLSGTFPVKPSIYYKNGTPLFIYNNHSNFLDLSMPEGSWFNSTTNQTYLRFTDMAKNPNNEKFYVSSDDSTMFIDNQEIDIYIYNITFNYGKFCIYAIDSKNITIVDNSFYDCKKGIYLFDQTKNLSNINIKNNNIQYEWNHDWGWLDFYATGENAANEPTGITISSLGDNDIISGNTIRGMFDGIQIYSRTESSALISNNVLSDLLDDGIEIEPKSGTITNSGKNINITHNYIYSTFSTISLAPHNSSRGRSSINYNILNANRTIKYNDTLDRDGKCFKLGADSLSSGRVTSEWDVTQNTCYTKRESIQELGQTYDINWTNNIFTNNGNYATILGTGLSENKIFFDNNLLFNYYGSFVIGRYNNLTYTGYMTVSSAVSSCDWDGKWDLNSITADPLFYNISAGNFSPTKDSPVCSMSSTGSYIGALPCLTVYSGLTGNACEQDSDCNTSFCAPWGVCADPDSSAPVVSFVNGTPANGSSLSGNSFVVNVSSSDANEHYVALDLDGSLLLHLRMENYSESCESSSHASVCTPKNISNVTGRFGNASLFMANYSYMNVSNESLFDVTGDLTLSAWINLDSYVDYARIVAKSTETRTAPYTIYGLMLDTNNRTRFELASGGKQHFVQSDEMIDVSEWHHLVATFDVSNQSMRLYLDGVLSNDTILNSTGGIETGLSNTSIDTNDVPVTVGASMYDFDYFDGRIDEVLIFNRTLSGAEVLSLFNASANQYLNNFSEVADGNHTITATAVDRLGFFSSATFTFYSLTQGNSCNADSECGSGFCVEGMCCDSSCDSSCQSCLATYNGGANGTCDYIVSGLDPYGECSSNCDGSGGCIYVPPTSSGGGSSGGGSGDSMVDCSIFDTSEVQYCYDGGYCVPCSSLDDLEEEGVVGEDDLDSLGDGEEDVSVFGGVGESEDNSSSFWFAVSDWFGQLFGSRESEPAVLEEDESSMWDGIGGWLSNIFSSNVVMSDNPGFGEEAGELVKEPNKVTAKIVEPIKETYRQSPWIIVAGLAAVILIIFLIIRFWQLITLPITFLLGFGIYGVAVIFLLFVAAVAWLYLRFWR